MKRRSFMGIASALAFSLSMTTSVIAKAEDFTIALVPGLTTDAFYITMERGAQAAADALGVKLVALSVSRAKSAQPQMRHQKQQHPAR